MSEVETKKFESWGIVEVMGHNTYAGFITEQAIGGSSLIRVDVPEIAARGPYSARQGFTKLIGVGSVYAITPCTEEAARAAADRLRSSPVTVVQLTPPSRQLAAAASFDCDDDDDDRQAD